MKITMKEIASQLGVSVATVSKVVNGKDEKISEKTKKRVWDCVHLNGYLPNRIARSMVTKSTKTIGLIIPSISNPFFPEVARGVEDRASESGYSIILCNTYDSIEKEDHVAKILTEKMVDGIIYTSSSRRKTVSEALRQLSIPIVSLDRDIQGLKSQGKVTLNNTLGARMAVEYLIQRGYKDIVHISGPSESIPTQLRKEAYTRVIKGRSATPLIYEGDYTAESGYKVTKQLINEGVTFDGLFCGNDLIAIGAIKALRESQINIPEDAGVIGFDDVYISKMIDLGLTTIAQPKYKMGYDVADLLIKMLTGLQVRTPVEILDPELVIRGTTR